jgi:hypothetical protein
MEVIRLKLRWVYVGGILAVTTLCGVLWSIQSGKEKGQEQEQEQVAQLEGQGNLLWKVFWNGILVNP